jgi:ATP-dependent helicase/nuclease subunit A
MSLPQNTVVWASAGTGKTRKLVETYVNLLETGADPLRIVAMTFTEKAAAELRDRVREAITTRMHEPAPERAPQQVTWMRSLALLPAAPVSTIHGFCGLLLREHGLHVGIDPSFTILDEQQSLDLARESGVETIRREIRAGNAAIERVFGDFGLDVLVEAVVSATYWINSIGKDPAWLKQRAVDQVLAAKALEDEMAPDLAKYGPDWEKIGLLADELDARRAPKHPLRKRDDPNAILPRVGQLAGASVSCALSELVALSVERFQARKRAANALDFDDLLLGARNLLRDVISIREHYQKYFDALLVDEFQDTDEVQAEIIQLLAQDPADASRFAAGKLMIVGDPKQSIYRFRRARVTVFVRMSKAILDGGGKLEHLRENYRSAPPIVEFSNRLSEQMLDGRGKHALCADVDLSYRIRFSEADVLQPRATQPFLGITYLAADAESAAAEGRAMEAESIARLLKTWKSSGVIQSWRDVAVLMRTMTNAPIYTDALEAHGIPVYVVQGSYFYQKTEVSDLIAVLELILRPNDPVARAIVLSSSLAGLSFGELLEKKTCESLDEILAPWIALRDRATAAEILQDVIRKTNYDVIMMSQKNGEQRVANIGKLIEITRRLARQGVTALDDVVRHLRDRARDPTAREPEAQAVDQDDEVVRVLTVHQAKGLEFDIVIIPDLAAKTRSGSGDRTFHHDRWGILAGAAYGLHRRALPHSLILRSKQEDDDQEFEEEKRLLYVAVTRARKMLVLGEGHAKHGGPWLAWLEGLFDNLQPGAIEKARGGTRVKVRVRGPRGQSQDLSIDVLPAVSFTRPQQLDLNIDIAAVNRDARFLELQALEQTVQMPRDQSFALEMTPSDLTSLRGCFRYFHWTRILGLADPCRTPSGDSPQMRLGSEAHKILESGVVPAADVLESRGLGDLQRVFASEDWQSLATSAVERELPFIMCIRAAGQECFVRGRMDAVVAGDPLRVIDYKFAVWKEGREAGYQIQMIAYALALMKSANVDRSIAELWYLKTPMKIVRQEYTRAESERVLSNLLERYLASLRTNEWPMAERTYCDSIECGFREQCWGASAVAPNP